MTDILRVAQALHRRYDQAQMARHRLMVPRQWGTLPPDCQAEFIGITQAALAGQTTYQGREIPTWVRDLVKEHK